MSLRGSFGVILMLALGVCAEEKPARTRPEFGRAFQQIQEGMKTLDVLRILGEPDDIRTKNDPRGISWTGVKEIWCYGTHGHLTFPELGHVYIDGDGAVKYFYGTHGAEDLVKALGEAELTRLLQILSRVPGEANPRTVIEAVNALQPLGKEKGCAVLGEYLRVARNSDAWWATWERNDSEVNLFLVARALFEVPEKNGNKKDRDYPSVSGNGFLRPPALGAPDPETPKNLELYPRFPLHILDDVPVCLVSGYSLAGRAEPLESHLSILEKEAAWRTTRLKPPENPFSVLEKLRKLDLWGNGEKRWGFERVEVQFCHMVDTVVPSRVNSLEETVAAFEKSEAVWDAKSSQYTFKDGRFLPKPLRAIYRRTIFVPVIPAAKIEVIVERQSFERIHFILDCSFKTPRPQKFSVAIYAIQNGAIAKEPLCRATHTEFHDSESWGCSSNTTVMLPQGQAVQMVLESEGKEQVSEVFKP